MQHGPNRCDGVRGAKWHLAIQSGLAGSMSVSVEGFYRRLIDSEVMMSAGVDELRGRLSQFTPEDDAHDLATTLVTEGRLTRYQARSLYRTRPRRLVYGNYLVLERIGKGGMGVVFKARHRMMQRIVALKVLPSDFAKNEVAISRFQREVIAAANLNHPNIVTAFDAAESHGTFYLAMEFVDGEDLASIVLNAARPLSPEAACDAVLQVSRGLEYAHANGVVHRDIKPSNLLRDREGVVRILDMGLALLDESTMSLPDTSSKAPLTAENTMMGTADFLAPEQAANTHKADGRADMYALASTWYFLVSGRPPFDGETPMAKVMAHTNSPIPSLSAVHSDVTVEQEAVYRRMMQKNPADRYPGMTDVVAQLAPLLDSVAVRTEISDSILFDAVPDASAPTRWDQDPDGPSDQFETLNLADGSSIELEVVSSASSVREQARRRDRASVVWMFAMAIGTIAVAAMAVYLAKG